MYDLIVHGAASAFAPINLAAIALGVVIGMVFGAIPGLSGATAMTMLLPLTFVFPTETGVLFLVAIWNAAVYAGSISAICLNIPGTAAAAACAIEGHALARRGLARRALRASIVGATIGGFVAAFSLLFLAPPLGAVALSFGPAEMFAFAVFGMAAVVSLAAGSMLRGAISALIGLVLATVGTAPSGEPRFVLIPELVSGLPLVPTLVGLFTLPVMLEMILERRTRVAVDLASLKGKDSFLLRLGDWSKHGFNIARSAVIGVFIGVVPGHGPTIASFIAYGEARRAARKPNEYGRGDVGGVLAPETAANAAVFSSLVPALTLGIPGSVDAVIILAALTMHGITPGPMLLERNAPEMYTIFMGAFVANTMMLMVATFGARPIANITRVPLAMIAPAIIVFSLVGAFSVSNSVLDAMFALGAGLFGYALRVLKIPLPPLVLSIILGTLVETHYLQMVTLYDSLWEALTRPVALGLLLVTFATVAYSLTKEVAGRWAPRPAGPIGDQETAA